MPIDRQKNIEAELEILMSRAEWWPEAALSALRRQSTEQVEGGSVGPLFSFLRLWRVQKIAPPWAGLNERAAGCGAVLGALAPRPTGQSGSCNSVPFCRSSGSIPGELRSSPMCEKCDEIDAKIAQYRRMLDGVDDLVAISLVNGSISDLESEMAALHPESEKPLS